MASNQNVLRICKTGLLAQAIVMALYLPAASARLNPPVFDPPALPVEARAALKRGVIAAKQQDYPLAIRYFEEARKSAPAAPEIFYELGLAESKIAGRELRSICWFEACLAGGPFFAEMGIGQ